MCTCADGRPVRDSVEYNGRPAMWKLATLEAFGKHAYRIFKQDDESVSVTRHGGFVMLCGLFIKGVPCETEHDVR